MLKKRRKPWGYACYEDKTMMEGDMKLVAKCSDEMDFSAHIVNAPEGVNLRVIDAFLNEHIKSVKVFLHRIPDPQNNTIRFLCLCGHGLSKEAADDLHSRPVDDGTKKSAVWPWELCSCRETMEQEASFMTLNAEKGDIVVFSSGFLTPEWVIAKLKDCEKDLRSRILKGIKLSNCEEELRSKVQNTIVIVIDACYSGMWKTRMQKNLTAKSLEFTRVILQTSCSEDEVSYGCCFIPVFCALQDDNTHTKV